MTPLRQRFVENLKLRKSAPQTQCHYLRCVEHYAEYFRKPVEKLGLEDVRAFLLYLVTEAEVSEPPFSLSEKVVLKMRSSRGPADRLSG